MIKLQSNYPLAPLTTFKIGGPAQFFVAIDNIVELSEALAFGKKQGLRTLLIGGGSNMLISDDGFAGLVVAINIKGIEIVSEDKTSVEIAVGAGEVWDQVVEYAVSNSYGGIENLSYIPGKAGAFAVQNVGAYGQEASQVVSQVQAYDTISGQIVNLTNEQCGFAYRTSIFNSTAKGRYWILMINLRLSKQPKPNLTYPDLVKKFTGQANLTLRDIRAAVIAIRNQKFPYPYIAGAKGSAGSFFRNFLLTVEQYEELQNNIKKNIPALLSDLVKVKSKFSSSTAIKIPAAFILEACGVKGMSYGGARINPTQPLVILNDFGQATAREVLGLVKEVREVVKAKTGLYLLLEPELVGFTSAELAEHGFSQQEIVRYSVNI